MKTIIFDGDDTLWKTQELYENTKQIFIKILQKNKIEDENTIKISNEIDLARAKLLGYAKTRFIDSLLLTYTLLCGKHDKKWNIEIEKEIRGLEKILFVKPELYEDAIETLEVLSKKFNLVLLTAGDKEIQSKKLDFFDDTFISYFSKIYIVPRKDDEIIKAIIQQLKISPSDVWSIGNSIKSDINPWIKIGANAILILRKGWAYEDEELLFSNTLKSSSLKAIVNYISEGKNVY